MRLFVVLALVAAALAEPEADPALVYTTGPDGVHTPVTYTKGVHAPVTYTTGVHAPVTYTVKSPVVTPVASTHTITNYHNPTHYTAVSNGAVGPKYIVKNGPIAHVVKREAEAEAEADPWYTTYSGMIPSYPTSVYPRYPVYPPVNSVPTINRVVPTINRVVPTINRVVPTVNTVSPTVNTVVPTVNTVVPTVNRVVP